MRVQELVEIYNSQAYKMLKPEQLCGKLKKDLNVKKYIPFVEKQQIAYAVLNDSVDDDNGIISINSVDEYFLFTIRMIEAHTNIEFSNDEYERYDEYDSICENGILDIVLSLFEDDYKASNGILNMMRRDLLENNNNINVVFGKLANKIGVVIDQFGKSVNKKVNEINITDLDINSIKNLLTQLR